MSWPAYLDLLASGELERRAADARRRLGRCTVCPRVCGVDRLRDQRGECRTGRRAIVASAFAHFGEEPPISGLRGSGTVFFGACNLQCVFCQNAEISALDQGEELDGPALATVLLCLQAQGCHNVNLVSPTHVVPQILEALAIAARQGLRLPIVYNTGGYDALPTLRLLAGVVDVYMPDAKYGDDAVGEQLSGVRHYWRVNRLALKEMHRQVGDLVVDERGVARRGLLVRHLVLPAGLAGTAEVVDFIAREISPDTYLNVMAQYRPHHRAWQVPALGRRTTPAEHEAAVELARRAGLRRDIGAP